MTLPQDGGPDYWHALALASIGLFLLTAGPAFALAGVGSEVRGGVAARRRR
jgi:hypothetical protein